MQHTKLSEQEVAKLKADFPLLQQPVNGHPLAYLDNAATTQKPQVVLDAMQDFYTRCNANVHRGTHTLTERATQLFEQARTGAQKLLNAQYAHECIFVRGATEGINLVAHGFGQWLKPGDQVVTTQIEHHANIVPWQMICERSGAQLTVVACNEQGELDLQHYQQLLTAHTQIVAIGHISNALGSINPIKTMIAMAHQQNIPVLIDGAQASGHMSVDVQALDCDFYTLSAHKMYGPTGIGILYGKEWWLEKLPPYQTGGEMIQRVSFSGTIFNQLPYKFEAGTAAIASAVGFNAAIDYLQKIGLPRIQRYEAFLLAKATEALSTIPGLSIIGQATEKAAVISFVLDKIHPHDISTLLDQQGIAIRSGRHCAEPTMERFGVVSTVRASFAMYNTLDEIKRLVEGLEQIKRLFKL